MTGPALSGSLVEGIGFPAMLFGIGVISILYCPVLFFLKNPPVRTEQEKQETSVKSQTLYETLTRAF